MKVHSNQFRVICDDTEWFNQLETISVVDDNNYNLIIEVLNDIPCGGSFIPLKELRKFAQEKTDFKIGIEVAGAYVEWFEGYKLTAKNSPFVATDIEKPHTILVKLNWNKRTIETL